MSSLLKFNYVNCKNEDKRIIDSNELIALKLEKLAEAQNFSKGNGHPNEFVEGLIGEEIAISEHQELEEQSPEAMIEEAKAIAEDLLEKARKEAEVIKAQGFSKGKQQGFDAGYSEGIAKNNMIREELKQKERQMEQNYHKQLEQMEPLLVDTIAQVFEEVFHIRFSDKKDLLLHLVQSAVSKIENSKEFIIKVSKEDFHQIRDKKELLMSKVSKAASIEIVEDLSLNKNQCMIETDGGIFDCGLDTQLEGLLKDLRILSSR